MTILTRWDSGDPIGQSLQKAPRRPVVVRSKPGGVKMPPAVKVPEVVFTVDKAAVNYTTLG